MALIAAVAVCVGRQAFAHLNGVGDVGGHLAHDNLVGTQYDPAEGTWIDGTAHDMSYMMGNVHGNCSICHFTVWNHKMSDVESYAVSATVGTADPQPDGTSKKCLSCHDGTVNLNAFTGGPNGGEGDVAPMANTNPAYLGTDLNHHHPVGIVYGDHLATSQMVELGDLNRYGVDPATMLNAAGTVECMTCHDPHTNYQANNPENEPGAHSHVHEWGSLLKYNSLCFQCHQRYQEGVQGRDVLPTRQFKGHHFPGRTDPEGVKRAGVNGNAIACNYCHDITGDGPHEPGDPHNSPCVDCHTHWDGEAGTSPEDDRLAGSYIGHHRRFDEALEGAVEKCGVCHADPGSTELTGSMFGSTETPGCDECHADIWSIADAPGVPSIDAGGPYSGIEGDAITVTVATANISGKVTVTWDMGDNTPVQFPTTEAIVDGTLTTTHTYAAAGVYNAVAVVTNGDDDPIAVEIEVTITATAGDGPDTWMIDDLDDGIDDYGITFGEQSDDGVFTSTDDSGNVGFGIEDAGTIFWIEMVFTADSWSVGDVYFGNIDRGAGSISGVIITADGTVEMFSGSK